MPIILDMRSVFFVSWRALGEGVSTWNIVQLNFSVGGSVIKELIAKSGCRIQVEQKVGRNSSLCLNLFACSSCVSTAQEMMAPGATQRSVTINGSSSQVEHAAQMINVGNCR